jgi:hypothetical protein
MVFQKKSSATFSFRKMPYPRDHFLIICEIMRYSIQLLPCLIVVNISTCFCIDVINGREDDPTEDIKGDVRKHEYAERKIDHRCEEIGNETLEFFFRILKYFAFNSCGKDDQMVVHLDFVKND